MNLNDVKKAWNSQADEFNQWDQLSCDEMVEFAIKFIVMQCKDISKQCAFASDQQHSIIDRINAVFGLNK